MLLILLLLLIEGIEALKVRDPDERGVSKERHADNEFTNYFI